MDPVLSVINKDQERKLRYIYYAIVGLLLAVLQSTVLSFISIGGIAPDLLIIFCVWTAVWEGQWAGIFFGFGAGLALDLLSNDVIGTNALAKTLVGFTAGFFFKENFQKKITGSYKFILISLLCVFIHNALYYIFYVKTTEISYFYFFLKYGIASTLYTALFSIFAMFSQAPFKR